MALAAALIGIEIWVRATWAPTRGQPGLFEADPIRAERLAPGYDGWFAGVPVRTNALGFRDSREYALAKTPGTVRIVVLGDSVTFGHGSVYEHTYPFLVEQRLRQWRSDVDWQVWNVAVPGYSTAQELAQLRDLGPRFQPDQIVVGFYENDLFENGRVRSPTRGQVIMTTIKNTVRPHWRSLEWYSRVYGQLRYRAFASAQERNTVAAVSSGEQLLAVPREVVRLRQQDLTNPAPVPETERVCPGPPVEAFSAAALEATPGFDEWRDSVRELQNLASAGVYRVAFFLNLAPRVCQTRDVYDSRSSQGFNDYLLAVMSTGTPAASAHDAFARYRPSDMPLANGHSIGNANAVKADVLFALLRDRLLPPILAAKGLSRQ
jgi:hypothetical protein